MSQRSCTEALAVLKDIHLDKTLAGKNISNDALVQSSAEKKVMSTDICQPELEAWALKSFALRKKADYDVATLTIPGLQEIKLLIWGGGMMAGFMGDGIGAACMSAVSAGISYAESKSWIQCVR